MSGDHPLDPGVGAEARGNRREGDVHRRRVEEPDERPGEHHGQAQLPAMIRLTHALEEAGSALGPLHQGEPAEGASTTEATIRPTGGPDGSIEAASEYVQTYRVRPSSPPRTQAKAPSVPVDILWSTRPPQATRSTSLCSGVSDPHRAFGVEADPVRHPCPEVGEEPAPVQGALVIDLEHGEPAGRRLGDDQLPAVAGDDRSVGKAEAIGDNPSRAARVDQHEVASGWLLAAREVVPEVADVGPPEPVHDHVVAVPSGEAGQVRRLCQLTVAVAQQAPVSHRDHEHVAAGRPAETAWTAGHLHHRCRTVVVEAHHPASPLLGEPQTALVPPGALRESKPAQNLLEVHQRSRVARRGSRPAPVRGAARASPAPRPRGSAIGGSPDRPVPHDRGGLRRHGHFDH